MDSGNPFWIIEPSQTTSGITTIMLPSRERSRIQFSAWIGGGANVWERMMGSLNMIH